MCTRRVEYTGMPLGLVNATDELQWQVIHDFPGPINEGRVLLCMDDVLVFSWTAQEHLEHLNKVLQLLREKGPKLFIFREDHQFSRVWCFRNLVLTRSCEN